VSGYSPQDQLSLALDGYRLSYLRAGDGGDDVLVFIHGWATSKDAWADVIADLSRDYTCVALDLPGMGDSAPRSDGDYAVTAMADSVEGFLDTLDCGPVTLLGHSTGGLISLMIAHRRPELVSRLVLVSAVIDGTLGPPFAPGIWVPRFGRLAMRFVRSLQVRSLRLFLLSMVPFLYDPARRWAIPYFERLYPYYLHYDIRGMNTLLLSLTKQDMTPHLWGITVPTLITSGEADRAVPHKQALEAARQMPNARLEFIPRAGHVAHLENLPGVLALFRSFLDETRERVDGHG
jgi:pimeloyl-ACP methyl ester carboxylesterase